jgi:Homeodomain-like domain-containing protein
MAMGRPKAALVLTPEQREQLEGLASSRSLPAGLVARAKIILLSAAGKTNLQIARKLELTNATVGKWRRRFPTPTRSLSSGRPRRIRSSPKSSDYVNVFRGRHTRNKHFPTLLLPQSLACSSTVPKLYQYLHWTTAVSRVQRHFVGQAVHLLQSFSLHLQLH